MGTKSPRNQDELSERLLVADAQVTLLGQLLPVGSIEKRKFCLNSIIIFGKNSFFLILIILIISYSDKMR